MPQTVYYAHSYHNYRQLLAHHLRQTGDLASKFGKKFGLAKTSELIGVLHDLGKYRHEFQAYLLSDGHMKKVDHASLPAVFIQQNLNWLTMLVTDKGHAQLMLEAVGNVCMGHHIGYMRDYADAGMSQGDFAKRIVHVAQDQKMVDQVSINFMADMRQYNPNFQMYLQNLVKEATTEYWDYIQRAVENKHIDSLVFYFVERLLYSILIDADHTNTAGGEEQIHWSNTQWFVDKSRHLDYFMRHLNAEDTSPLAPVRRAMSDICVRGADSKLTIRTLDILTGGGKTLASLRFAIRSAIIHQRQQVIIVVPLLSVIEQNVSAIRTALGVKVEDLTVLESDSNPQANHHKNQIDEEIDGLQSRLDDWDAPVIVTTMVTFLNTVYGRGTRWARHYKSLCDAVIIFDEVQSIPANSVKLFAAAIEEMTKWMPCQMLLCTATQPDFHFLLPTLHIPDQAEVVPSSYTENPVFDRIRFHWYIRGSYTPAAVVDHVRHFLENNKQKVRSLLIIANTRVFAAAVAENLRKHPLRSNDHVVQVDAGICHRERTDRIDTIKDFLQRQETVVCVSTQVMQAGVDVSFDYVVRALAGIDSIVQSAGRCNRNAEAGIRIVDILRCRDGLNGDIVPDIYYGEVATETVANKLPETLDNILIKNYFDRFYQIRKPEYLVQVDSNHQNYSAYTLLAGNPAWRLRHSPWHYQMVGTVQKQYQPIPEQDTVSVVVAYGVDGQETCRKIYAAFQQHYATIKERSQTLRQARQLAQDFVITMSPRRFAKEYAARSVLLTDGYYVQYPIDHSEKEDAK
ncbi:CRISPR-associated endonuclease Cas3'' [Schleiferilactobacillus perolens]|jgi:CRISPR-associated endonuclease/helicase Cas3|uniref:CRISPR-associated endonuclease Cas3'' n=1 Tax=Schleiferilactobacillus perolens TaxID=100468 RepID=UPI00235412FE|nr:CRISPR-associated endonuclease Cas3'' [Schleiferilactobacillus perolens]MCI2170026.1 CRISPR-associated endonuclease Cas3'' [Schleiferilactobacillus perolens]